jgi:chaperonin cofactor prefoldin
VEISDLTGDELLRVLATLANPQEHIDLRLTDLGVQVESLRDQLEQMQHILKEVE